MLVRPEDWQPQGVAELEDRAWVALREVERSVCVTAGAGAGKTEFLAQKAAYLLQTGLCRSPQRVLAISYKRDAARTLADRVNRRCSDMQARRFDSYTFDAFTKKIVDQFRSAVPAAWRPSNDYEIGFFTYDQMNDFMRQAGMAGRTVQWFESMLRRAPLPIEAGAIDERTARAVERFWREQYDRDPCLLTFPMLNRIAHYLLRSNPRIVAALRQTYPHVFLDEFQDTTTAQYQLLMTAFGTRSTKFTAVGDDKQRIMVWAGAMRNAFERFTQDCDARCVSLLLNWRSHEDLVAIQHRIASEIVPDIERPIARQVRTVDGDVSAIWSFRDRAEEMETLAAWLVREVENGVPADRFAILVRMRVDRIAEELGPEFEAVGLMLRNVARQVGEIAIQDLLVEPFTEVAMPFLRSAATRRAPDAWTQAQRAILLMEGGNEADEEAIERASRRAQSAVRAIRAFMEESPPNEDTGTELLNLALEEIGATAIKASSPAYSRDEDYERVRLGFSTLLNECAEEAGTWEEVLNRFEGKDQVPLMTIHKSKGMEFHTVIFFGLDDRSWRSLAPGETEELNNFFVAFTRAEQRAFFTSCSARGAPIAWIEELLGEEVPRVEGADLLA